MKTLKYTNANGTLDVEYLVDLIGDNDMMTVYQVCQYVDGVKQVNMNGTAVTFGMPDKYEQTVNTDNTRTKYTLKEFEQLAVDKNLTLEIYEDGEDMVTSNTLTSLAWVTAALDAGTSGAAYEFELDVEGGNSPYIFSTESTLPAGIELSADGVLSGTPTEDGTFTLTITVTDQFGVSVDLEDVDLVIAAE